jgi:hypothetical protein
MHGLVESAIERETERLDQISESANLVPSFFALRPFFSRLNPQTGKFDGRATSRRHFSMRNATAPQYLQ